MNFVPPELPELRTRVDLSGQVAIVTGAAGGIGYGIAEGLAKSAATVVVADLHAEAARRAAGDLSAAGLATVAAQVDVADEASVAAMVESVVGDHGSVEILVNNAAVATNEIVEQTSAEDWRRVIDVNLTGPFICAKAVLPHMTAANYGRIVNISSIAARRISLTHGASYTAAKAGLLAFTRHLAYEVAGRGVTVNAICPGATLTARVAAHMGGPEAVKARGKTIPRGRLALPDDVMRGVLFLVSDLADMVCGQAIDVDGGELLGWSDTESYFKRRGVAIGQ